ncbi:NusG domain II-containing protein [Parablautia muri]|uniref:NusG domain II-containing protein n=1 Tax=Parablautia muri TaxID=2320879 RepID=A0A9X5BCJ9_9FIRM|nr:NusG domain II-containing protein [Parablautia muri]NBJ91504.1 NusG domain II-containing protein [Parablautia muri]
MGKVRKDITIISGIILAAFLFWIIPLLLNERADMNDGRVRVFQDGEEIGVYDVLENQSVLLPYEEEHYNLMVIQDGKVSVAEADCPDGLCTRQREISRNGESIICLPHKLVIRIESNKEGAPDAVTY